MGEFIGRTRGFTPAFDAVLEDLGMKAAAVHGVVWRLGVVNGSGQCKASAAEIARLLGFSSRQTAQKYLDVLVEHGYITDLTPDAQGVAHAYADAGRVELVGKFTAGLTC